MVLSTLIGVFVLMFVSISLNAFGIYCLRKQNGGNINQRMLLQNLSVIEIVKMIFDYVSLTLYQFQNAWYLKYYIYMDIIEVNLMTILFISVLLISVDRLACVTLQLRYNHSVNQKLVQDILITTWLVGQTPGLIMWALASASEYAKAYYYMVFDVLIIFITLLVYITMIYLLHRRRRKFPNLTEGQGPRRNLKMFLIPCLIITSYIFFNAIPDLILMKHFSHRIYHVTCYLWAFGFVSDPLIYIFINKKSRKIAKRSFNHIKSIHCNPLRMPFRRNTPKDSLAVTYLHSRSRTSESDETTRIFQVSLKTSRHASIDELKEL